MLVSLSSQKVLSNSLEKCSLPQGGTDGHSSVDTLVFGSELKHLRENEDRRGLFTLTFWEARVKPFQFD